MAGWRGSDGSSRGRKSPRDGSAPHAERRAPSEPRKTILRKPGERRAGGDSIWYNRMAWAALACVLIAVTIGVILWMQQPLPLLACVVDYSGSDPLIPPNAFARNDVDRFLGLDAAASSFRSRKPAFASLHELLEYLKRPDRKPGSLLNPGFGGGPGKRELVIYVSAHGVVDSRGEPCLLDAGVDPLDETNDSKWRTVRGLLNDLEAHVPADVRRVVLLLDSGRAEVSWSLGWLDPSFPEKLAAVWNDLKPKRFWLVHSRSAASERNWTSPKLNASTFGLHVVRALSSASDANRDGKISFAEFCQHLDREQTAWVRTYRAAMQHIQILVPNDKPFLLAQAVKPPKSEEPAKGSGLADLQPLSKLWNDVDELRAHEPWRARPLAWAKLQHRLLDAEQLWLAGRASQSAFDKALRSANELRDLLKQPARPPQLPEGSPLWTLPAWLAPPAGISTPDWEAPLQFSGAEFPRRLLEAADESGASIESAYARLVARYVDFASVNEPLVKDLLRLRRRAEAVAALPSVLAWPVVQQRIVDADGRRRLLEDAAWIGGAAQREHLAVELPRVREDYEQADAAARDWLELLRQRDHMLAELPWLIRWAEVEGDAALLEPLLAARRTLWDFRAAFQDANPGSSAREDWNGVWNRFVETRRSFEERCRSVDNTALNAAFIPRALRLLQVPLTAGNRELLLKGLEVQLAKDGEQTSAPATQSEEAPQSESTPALEPELQPLLALLSERPGDAVRVSPDKAGGKVRLQFRRTEGAAARPFGDLDNELKSVKNPDLKKSPDVLAREWRDVEWLGRAWAAVYPQGCQVIGEPPVTIDDAVASQLELLQDRFGVWQAERTIRDFYGPAEPGAKPLFVPPAHWWLDFAAHTKLLRSTIDQRRRDLDELEKICRNLLAVSLKTPQQEAGDLKSQQEVQVTFAGPALPVRVDEHLYPNGAPAAWLEAEAPGPRRQLRPGPNDGRHRVAAEGGVGLRQENLRRELGGENWKFAPDELFPNNAKEARLAAVLFFRGHLARATSTLKAPEYETGIRRSYEAPPDRLSTTIQVNGDAQRRLWLMIVLDCSGSMAEPFGLAADKANPNRNRFSVARENLLSTLRDLRETPHAASLQVAFMAYGSQVGIGKSKDTLADGSAKYVQKFLWPGEKEPRDDPPPDSNLHPATDVRLWVDFQPQKPLTAQVDEIIAKVQELQPLGCTPLYLSVRRAVERLRAINADQEQKIVLVVTDGVNEVYPTEQTDCDRFNLPVPPASDLVSKTRLENFLDREGRDIDVRIVGFAMERPAVLRAKAQNAPNSDLARKFTRDAEELENLENLCRTSDGQDRPRRRLKYDEGSDALVDELKRLVPKVEFEVTSGDQRIGGGPLGHTVNLDRPGEYLVRVAGSRPAQSPRMALHDGEQLVLTYVEGPPSSLTFARFPNPNEPGSDEKTEGPPKRLDNWWVAALPRDTQVKLPPAARQFRIAVQPPPERLTEFPARPEFVVAIVYPQERAGAAARDLPPETAPPYVFFPSDVQFERQRPSPVLILETSDWPVQATAARIRLWFRPPGSRLPATFDRKLDDLEAGLLTLPPQLRNVRLQLLKTEPRDDGTAVLRLLQTNLQPDWLKTGNPAWVFLDPRPRRWSRMIFPRENRIEHEFVLERFNQQEFRLLATPLQTLLEDDSAGGEIVEVELTGIRVSEN